MAVNQVIHVVEFLNQAREVVRRSEARVLELSRQCQVAAARVAQLRDDQSSERRSDALIDTLLQEVSVRDEELAVACDELRRQLQDVTQANAFLGRERAKYLDLFENAPDAYLVTDGRGVVLEANRRAGTLLGIEPRFLIRKPIIGFVVRGDTQHFRLALAGLTEQMRTEHETHSLRVRMRARGGSIFDAALNLTRIRTPGDHGGMVLRWIIRAVESSPAIRPESPSEADRTASVVSVRADSPDRALKQRP